MAAFPLPRGLASLVASAAAAVGRIDRAVLGLYCQLVSTLLISVMALVAKVAGASYGIPVFELVCGWLVKHGEASDWQWW